MSAGLFSKQVFLRVVCKEQLTESALQNLNIVVSRSDEVGLKDLSRGRDNFVFVLLRFFNSESQRHN